MKTLDQPSDCIRYPLPQGIGCAIEEARRSTIRARLRRLKTGRTAAWDLAASFDRAIYNEERRLHAEETTKLGNTIDAGPQAGLSVQDLSEDSSEDTRLARPGTEGDEGEKEGKEDEKEDRQRA